MGRLLTLRPALLIVATALIAACSESDSAVGDDTRLVRTAPTDDPIVYGMAVDQGTIAAVDGCIRLVRKDGSSSVLVYPFNYRLVRDGKRVLVENERGHRLYAVGQSVQVGGSLLPDEASARLVSSTDRQRCTGSYFLVLPQK